MEERRKTLTGTVVSGKMDKTVIVVVETTTRHRIYHKIMKHSKRYMAHDDRLEAKPGDTVRIMETRPYSRHKRWRVAEIIQRGEVAEIAPREIDAEYLSMTRERQEPPAPAAAAEATEASTEETAAVPEESAPTGEPAEAEAPAEAIEQPEEDRDEP